jgi:hypothetical protein
MFGWGDRSTKADVKHRIGGDNPARVVSVGYGQYEVTVPDDPEAEITYKKPHYTASDPRQTFPNMEVRDGEMRIPIDDIVSAVLARVEPVEIAIALWANDDVRSEFMDALVTRYNERNIGDEDRRKFLAGVKEAVHSKALDRLASAAAKLEYEFSRKWSFYHEINRVNEMLRAREYTDHEGNPIQLQHKDNDAIFKIGGVVWNGARDHWREEALRLFPAQAIEARQGRDEGSVHESAVPNGDAP